MTRVAKTAVTVLVVALAATACTAQPEETLPPVPPPPALSPSPSPSPLGPPVLRPGHAQLGAASHRGSWDVGAVTLRKGVNWIDVNCRSDRGTQILTLNMGTVGSFTVDCPSTENRTSVNQLDLARGRKDRLTVEVADSVQWYASVQVPEPAATASSTP